MERHSSMPGVDRLIHGMFDNRQKIREMLIPLRRGIWGLFDNGLISATNFCTMVLLARVLNLEAFGKFTLAYSVLLFFNSAQSALVIQPHTVQGSVRSGADYREYTTATGILQMG